MKPNPNPTANPMIVLREEFDDWAILFDPDTGDAHGINPVGVYIWKHLDGKHTVSEILRKLGENCDGVPADAETDVTEFIEDLVKRGYAGYEAG
jgi:SynChlorMet cassette protein ScmD